MVRTLIEVPHRRWRLLTPMIQRLKRNGSQRHLFTRCARLEGRGDKESSTTEPPANVTMACLSASPTKLLQRISFLAAPTSRCSSTTPSSSASSTTGAVFVERDESLAGLITGLSTGDLGAGDRRHARQQVLRHMLHMRLHARRMERFVVPQILQVQRVILEVGLAHPRQRRRGRHHCTDTHAPSAYPSSGSPSSAP